MKIAIQFSLYRFDKNNKPHITRFINRLCLSKFMVLESATYIEIRGQFEEIMLFVSEEIKQCFSEVDLVDLVDLKMRVIKMEPKAYERLF